MAAARWVGRGDKESADQAAVDGMRLMLDTVVDERRGRHRRGGEGQGADALQRRARRGRGGPGRRRRRRSARGHPADGERRTERDRGDRRWPSAGRCSSPAPPSTWTRSPSARRGADAIDINSSPAENVRRVAEAKGVRPEDIAVVVLDRDRHESLIAELRETGAKVRLIMDGDVAPSIAAAREGTGVDLLMGIGGTPEGVISAAAIKCLGGAMQCKLWPRDDEERQRLAEAGVRRRARPDARRSRLGRRPVRRRDRRHGRCAAARRPGAGRHRRDRVDRHALALGHDPAHPCGAPPGEARPARPAVAIPDGGTAVTGLGLSLP